MKVQLIRHATVVIEIRNKRILLDPMLGPQGCMAAVPGVPNTGRNPLVGLPIPAADLLNVDALLISHLHRDHFDDTAMHMLPKDIPVFFQPSDLEELAKAGFKQLLAIEDSLVWEGIRIFRTGGQHGTGSIRQKMGRVAGFVLSCEGEPSLYITGDTIWCAEVEEAITRYEPQVIICYAGAARFDQGAPITMGEEDISRVAGAAPEARILAIHMEAWNHCRLTRQELKDYTAKHGLPVLVMDDGEEFNC